jgi:hypothetical protein
MPGLLYKRSWFYDLEASSIFSFSLLLLAFTFLSGADRAGLGMGAIFRRLFQSTAAAAGLPLFISAEMKTKCHEQNSNDKKYKSNYKFGHVVQLLNAT